MSDLATKMSLSATSDKAKHQGPSSCHVLAGAWGKTPSGAGKYFPNRHPRKHRFHLMIKSAVATACILLAFVCQIATAAVTDHRREYTDQELAALGDNTMVSTDWMPMLQDHMIKHELDEVPMQQHELKEIFPGVKRDQVILISTKLKNQELRSTIIENVNKIIAEQEAAAAEAAAAKAAAEAAAEEDRRNAEAERLSRLEEYEEKAHAKKKEQLDKSLLANEPLIEFIGKTRKRMGSMKLMDSQLAALKKNSSAYIAATQQMEEVKNRITQFEDWMKRLKTVPADQIVNDDFQRFRFERFESRTTRNVQANQRSAFAEDFWKTRRINVKLVRQKDANTATKAKNSYTLQMMTLKNLKVSDIDAYAGIKDQMNYYRQDVNDNGIILDCQREKGSRTIILPITGFKVFQDGDKFNVENYGNVCYEFTGSMAFKQDNKSGRWNLEDKKMNKEVGWILARQVVRFWIHEEDYAYNKNGKTLESYYKQLVETQ